MKLAEGASFLKGNNTYPLSLKGIDRGTYYLQIKGEVEDVFCRMEVGDVT